MPAPVDLRQIYGAKSFLSLKRITIRDCDIRVRHVKMGVRMPAQKDDPKASQPGSGVCIEYTPTVPS